MLSGVLRGRVLLVAAVLTMALLSPVAARAAAGPTVSLRVSRAHIHSGQIVAVSGVLSGAPAGTTVDVYESPYPYRSRTLLGALTPNAAGAFATTARPDRNTWFVAVAQAGAARLSAQAAVTVSGRTIISERALSLGRAEVKILIFRPSDLSGWNGAKAWWRFSSAGQTVHTRTVTTRLSRYVTEVRAVVTLPAGRYRWWVCFYARDDLALDDPGRAADCHGRGYSGASSLPAGFPGPGAVGAASRYLGGRAGRTAFAVIDSEGRLSGVHVHWTFVSASVVKAMLLVAYLRRLDARGQHFVDSTSNSFLDPMINVSDNSAATHTWSIVGDSGLYSVARAAGMTDFSIVGIWANAQISAADQARFFFEMDSLIPREFVGYARRLLSTIAAFESWGIPAVARPMGYAVFFKGGWRSTGLGQLVHQVGRLERPGRVFSIAVMTDGDPSMGYGIATIEGVTHALLG
jgi:hypothetical protein